MGWSMSEKSKTAFGYTETAIGPVKHLKVIDAYGIKGMSLDAPVALMPHHRSGAQMPYPEMCNGKTVHVLPGGSRITS